MASTPCWTNEEEALLIEKYNKLPNKELVLLFPRRSYLGIYKKARALGLYKDPEIEFINRSNAKSGELNSCWKGGKRITAKGYIQVLDKKHPRADSSGYVMEHIKVFEEATGIRVPKNCDVHHINGNKQDNSINNLCLLTHGAHTALHNRRKEI